MTIKSADLCDKYGDQLRYITLPFNDYGGVAAFYGEIVTIQCFEDNSFVKRTLEQPGRGRVLLVDGGASMRCALLGDMLAQLAIDHRWRGIVINGCIRDSDIIGTLGIGVKALATHPRKSEKKNNGYCNVQVYIGGASCNSGDWLYADHDGIIISSKALQLAND